MKIYFIIVAFFLSLNGFSQNIVDFFEMIPNSFLNLTKEKRKEISKYSLNNRNNEDISKDLSTYNIKYAFVADIKNGYLWLEGAFDGHLEMCYWNISNGNKLIAVYIQGCAPVCSVYLFDFYLYNGKNIQKLNSDDIIPDIYNDFFGKNIEKKQQNMKKKDILATLLFELPKKGKDIMAKWGNEDKQSVYKTYGIGDRMLLKWNDGKFEKSKIYWNKE